MQEQIPAVTPFLQRNPNLLVFTFLQGFICNLLQVDQLVPSIKGICKMVRKTLEGLHSQGSLGQLEATSSFRRPEQSSCTAVRESREAADGKGFLICPFSLEKQMPREMVKFLPWERFQFDPTSILGIFCGE